MVFRYLAIKIVSLKIQNYSRGYSKVSEYGDGKSAGKLLRTKLQAPVLRNLDGENLATSGADSAQL